MSLTAYERETVIRWCDDKDEACTVFTHSKSRADKLVALGATLKRVSKHEGEAVAWTLECPREWAKFPSPKKRVSAEQRKAAGERLSAARQNRILAQNPKHTNAAEDPSHD